MSKRNRRNNTVMIDRRELERLVDTAIERKYTPPQGSTVTPIPQNIINQMMASLAPQAKTQGMFAPGAPLQPNPNITPAQGPRQWQYPVGYNIGQLPRSTETTSFDTLRNLASLYDGIAICQQVWFDLCSKPELVIKPRDELTKDKNGKPIPQAELDAKYGARIAKWKAFFAKPDRKRSLKQWMRMMLKERLEIDALSIFKHKDRAGRLYALEIIDGATIKPLLDERGMEPSPPFPAYQQFVYGVPGMEMLSTQVIYRRETERTDSPYGMSRVERIILRVNQALRKQNRDLSSFTDGNVPVGFLEPPEDGSEWKPEDLLTYQTMWDAMLAGNEAIKARVKVIPPGAKFIKTDPDDIMTPFDTFLLNITVGAHGLTMSELGFTESVNKSSGETQEAVIYRRTMSPTMDTTAEIFTDVMTEEDGNDDLVAGWKAFEEVEDFKTKAEAEDILVKNGTMSTSQGSRWLGIEPPFETEPFITVPGQGIVFTKDANDPKVRKAANQAKLAGFKQAANPPDEDDNEEGDTNDGQSSNAGNPRNTRDSQGEENQRTVRADRDGRHSHPVQDSQTRGRFYSPELAPRTPREETHSAYKEKTVGYEQEPHEPPQGAQGSQDGTTGANGTTTPDDTDSAGEPPEDDSGHESSSAHRSIQQALPGQPENVERAISAEYRRWRECAIKDIKTGKPVRNFTSDIMAEELMTPIRQALERCQTVEDVRAVFRAKQLLDEEAK